MNYSTAEESFFHAVASNGPFTPITAKSPLCSTAGRIHDFLLVLTVFCEQVTTQEGSMRKQASLRALMQPPQATVCGQTQSKTQDKQRRSAGFWADRRLWTWREKTSKQTQKPLWPCENGQTAVFYQWIMRMCGRRPFCSSQLYEAWKRVAGWKRPNRQM